MALCFLDLRPSQEAAPRVWGRLVASRHAGDRGSPGMLGKVGTPEHLTRNRRSPRTRIDHDHLRPPVQQGHRGGCRAGYYRALPARVGTSARHGAPPPEATRTSRPSAGAARPLLKGDGSRFSRFRRPPALRDGTRRPPRPAPSWEERATASTFFMVAGCLRKLSPESCGRLRRRESMVTGLRATAPTPP